MEPVIERLANDAGDVPGGTAWQAADAKGSASAHARR
jgi:hypothetical protein